MIIDKYPEFSIRHILKEYIIVAIFNIVIACLLWVLIPSKDTFLTFLLLSQFIGLSICTIGNIAFGLLQPATTFKQILLLIICLIIGSLTGIFLASLFFETKLINYFFSVLSVGIIFGVIITYFFVAHEKYSQLKLAKQEEELKRISLEKENIQANLKLLQAQIEPHFLFNTLSTVLSLLETDVKTGQKMLENLTQYLRTSLKHTRNKSNSLKQEIETIQSYLEINKIRMGNRLNFNIEIPDSLHNILFPPMLIQPIVENAVKHGIEPKVDGGTITVKVSKKKLDKIRKLEIEIADTGLGINSELSSKIGLDNVKERIKALYGEDGHIIFTDNEPSGLIVTIRVPYEKDYSNNS